MSNILKSTFGKAATILSIAGLAMVAFGANAEARPYNHWDRGHVWAHPYHWDHARWYGGYYAPRYYAVPPVYAYPPAYYGPPSLNFNIPLG